MKILNLMIISCILILACKQNGRDIKTGKCYNVLNADEFETLIKNREQLYLIDVRSEDEYNSGHIANSYNWDINSNEFKSNLKLLPKNDSIFLYCRSGNRSKLAARVLIDSGFCNIFDLQGGFIVWIEENKVVE